ncbi:murein transglycosylase [Phytohabitans rumicis]|uniref:Murein transglycosylase n=1 Tax=Phytohabitans rumicis TaxID=1076125 RepID=A0A6V8LAK6_9ACTN|nr:murein transglycosylase [Phytohabitans rumicis]
MADGEATPPTERPLRSATPEWAGPLGSSGAAPEQEPEASTPAPKSEPATVTVGPASVVPDAPKPERPRRRMPGPRQAARAVGSWARRPSGRLTLPGVLLLVLVVAGAGAGAIVIPMTAGSRTDAAGGTPSPEATGTAQAPDALGPTGIPTGGFPTTVPTATPTATGAASVGRPADVLAGWATQTATKVDIPWVAMQAYGYAELVLAQTRPGCQLRWTTLAAIGKVESNHGRHNATLGTDGQSAPRILGPALDGTNNTQRILDSDDGVLDGDLTYDRAVGPMQFIPSTWRLHEIDADNDGLKDPNDIDDATLAAGNYLCQGTRNLSSGTDWWNAIYSYNDVKPYAQAVFDAANDYGAKSRT